VNLRTVVSFALLGAAGVMGQSGAIAPEFEVVSVKANKSYHNARGAVRASVGELDKYILEAACRDCL
jgi:hypothetical protein